MRTNDKAITMRLPAAIYERIVRMAEAEQRSYSAMMRLLVLHGMANRKPTRGRKARAFERKARVS